jgi:hypothetical protein
MRVQRWPVKTKCGTGLQASAPDRRLGCKSRRKKGCLETVESCVKARLVSCDDGDVSASREQQLGEGESESR